ncbi:probable phosphoglycerate mutase [Sphingomonas laterariae]|uniref:Probable phosphoglycerate mutase n=1 Tax=Edaphosphingomonas laterariae TaxID=861865 RepID=A0A239HJF6_9SPHN|nr:probable phosphoglycerate mutase [Sphingomonas laterariae]
MGRALRDRLGVGPALALWASDTGRALQTLAIICDHLELDWHAARTDPRLREMGMGGWGGLYYDAIRAEGGRLIDPVSGLFVRRAPGGEWYDDVAGRLRGWIGERAGDVGDRLVIMHGLSGRVLRGLLTGAAVDSACRAPVAAGQPQGSIAMIAGGRETVIHEGAGQAPA